MTQEEFVNLQVGDRLSHPSFGRIFTVAQIEAYNGETYAVTTDDGRRLKQHDPDVARITKIDRSNP